MKTVHKTRNKGESCSCTTCVNKSESDDSSLRRIINLKPRIDRLYDTKYIALRERRLLQRLVRTRAVYDDIRAQLLSESTVSLSTKEDFNPGPIRELVDTDNSSEAVLELVNIIDRGAIGSKKLDDCCSCCSCSSKTKPHEHHFNRHRLKRPYAGANTYKAIERRREYRKQREPRNRAGVRFKTKLIRSDPCTCTFKLIKKHSEAILKRNLARPPLSFELQPTTDEELKHKRRRISDIARSSYQNLMQSNIRMKAKISERISKIRESQTRMQEKLELQKKMSLEKFSQAKDKLTSKARASAQRIKTIKEKTKLQIDNEIPFQVKKDSVHKYKEEQRRKQIMKDWECEPECNEDTCVPEECFQKLKQNRFNRMNYHHKGINYDIRTQGRKAGTRQINNKVPKLARDKTIGTQKPILRAHALQGSLVSFNKGPDSQNIQKFEVANNQERERVQKIIPATKQISASKLKSHALKRCFCTLKLKAKATKSKIRRSVAKKVMTMEKSASTLNSALNINDFKTNTDHKRKKSKSMRTKSNHSYECEPGVCLPGYCDPYECIQLINIPDAKRKYSSFPPRKTKSTSSFTSRTYNPAKAKYVQSMITPRGADESKSAEEKEHIRRGNAFSNSHRQAVRIGSTFSFNIEFYKETKQPNIDHQIKRPPDLKSLSIIPKHKVSQKVQLQSRGFQGNLRNIQRNTPTQMVKKDRHARVGSTLTRCLCTLKLQKKEIMRNHRMNTFKTSPETAELKPIDTANKSTKTKSIYSITLEPYECEPFTCIPGECDPYVCLDRINKRNIRLKEIGLNTGFKPTTSSSSNTYRKKSSKTVQVQYKPRYKQRKVLAKTQKPKKYIENKHVSQYPSRAGSRQAVKIGSTYSFNIEFYKNKVPSKEIKEMYTTKKITKASTKKGQRQDKEFKINRLNVAQVETHVQGPWKRDKGSVVGPILKRCICTLNLQKKWKHEYSRNERFNFLPPRVYTVNRAIIEDTQARNICQIPLNSSFYGKLRSTKLNKTSSSVQFIKNLTAHERSSPDFHVEAWDPLKFKSDLSTEQDTLKVLQRCKKTNTIQPQPCVEPSEYIKRTFDTFDFYRNSLSSSHIHQTHLDSLTHYLRRSFYTMNIEVENRGNFKEHNNAYNTELNRKKKRGLYKLEPYECEPGVCIPGECNPYECQKMILKRLTKSSSIKSGTEDPSHSISSSVSQPMSKHKTYKQQTVLQKSTKPVVNNKTRNNKQKQAVRIGSSFSFDIEFSKKLSTSHENEVLPKYPAHMTNLAKRAKHSKSKSTGKRKKTYDLHSQSFVQTKSRGSFTKPAIKRCFCTLKLQKKGRLHKESQDQQLVKSPNNYNKQKTMNRGQNTNKIKPLKFSHALEPYECEPNICVPGQCDPYQCLEIIKKRHNYEVGTSTLLHETKSMSSMTTNTQEEKKHRSLAVNVKPKTNTNLSKYGKNYTEFEKPLRRNAVRIGSSLSFNIEFFKDHSSALHHNVQGKSKKNGYSRQPLPNLKKHTHAYTSNNQNFRHQRSQVEHNAQHASTLSNSVMKRCFCTAQLYESKNQNEILKSERNENSLSFIKKCACLFKKIKPTSNFSTNKNVRSIETQDQKVNTHKIQDKSKKLYCKPHICIPEKCDSNICGKIMRKYPNRNFKASTTDMLKTPSINSPNSGKKNYKTLMKHNDNISYIKPKRYENLRINKPNAVSWSPDRNVVRIGSKFSFDIEFYKDQPGTKNNQKPKTYQSKLLKDTENKRLANTNSITQFVPNTMSQSSQVNKNLVTDRGIGINNLIKRCFCTLKLNDFHKYSHKDKVQEIHDQDIKKNTKSVMTEEKKNLFSKTLLPYECEPYICIPYQCDPYECKKLIELRHNRDRRELGVSTLSPNKVSAYSLTDGKKYKTKSQYIKSKNKIAKPTPHKHTNKVNIGQSKQSVRIGSTFSFNIEFFKDKQNNGFELQKNPKKHLYDHERIKKQANDRRKYITNQTQILNKKKNTNYTQFDNQMTRTQSTMTGLHTMLNKSTATMKIPTKTFLKRCFCTLKLQKAEGNKIPHIVDKPKQRQLYTENKKTSSMEMPLNVHHLSKFECEPFYCVPGECDPYKCKERIKLREKTFKTQNTITPYIPGSQKSVGIKQENMKAQKSKGSLIRSDTMAPEIAETSMFTKQAVTIGSNFSFNIEFFKENLPQTAVSESGYEKKRKMEIQKNILDHGQNTKITLSRSLASEYDKTKTQDKSAQKENSLKRCFCTLKLNDKKYNMEPMIPFPQTLKVGRVAVHHNPEMFSQGTNVRVKSLGTKIDKLDLASKKKPEFDRCKCCTIDRKRNICQNSKTILPDELETLLPYKPDKFNKTESKIVLPPKNKCNKEKKTMKINSGKKLTRNSPNKNLYKTQTIIPNQRKPKKNNRFLRIKTFLNYCAQLLIPKSTMSVIENIRDNIPLDRNICSKRDRQVRPSKLISNSKPKPTTCTSCIQNKKQGPPRTIKVNKKQNTNSKSLNVKLNSKEQTTEKTIDKPFEVKNVKGVQVKKGKKRSPPARVRFLNSTTPKTNNIDNKMNKEASHYTNKPITIGTKTAQVAQSPNYCHPCRIKINKETFSAKSTQVAQLPNFCHSCRHKMNKEEFHNAAGDQLFNKINKAREMFFGSQATKQDCKPLFEMHLDSENSDILNKDQVAGNVSKLNTKCKEKPLIEMKLDAKKFTILNKEAVLDTIAKSNTKSAKNRLIGSIMEIVGKRSCPCPRCVCASRNFIQKGASAKPCVCGSLVCATHLKKRRDKRYKWKPCACGNPICDRESKKMRAILVKKERMMEERRAKHQAMVLKNRENRLKRYSQSDKQRNKERRKREALLEKHINTKSPAAILMAENVIDIGKLGITATTDILRQVFRIARDPKHTYETLKTLKENPHLIQGMLQSPCECHGLRATMRRVRLRCFAMRGIEQFRLQMQDSPLTKYLDDMSDSIQGPGRKKKKKKKLIAQHHERKEPKCNFFLASLRKRPFLTVYNRCPWFYPHLLSLLHVWKQFTEIALFILAAVVWSPCILCMELCRACMCCFLCTG